MKKEFKVWEIKNERWLEQDYTSISADGSKVWCCGDSYGEDEVVVCYFTGLLDKNGRKIFEDDILANGDGMHWQVIWAESKARFELMWVNNPKGFDGRLGHFMTTMQRYLVERMSVMANIHEVAAAFDERSKKRGEK